MKTSKHHTSEFPMKEVAPILLFDGVCNLCNSSVQFIIKRDKKALFKFAALQSEKGQELLVRHGLSTTDFTTFVLVEGDRYFVKSTAILKVARHLDGLWKLAYSLIFVPAPLRNWIYSIVSKNRIRWFGQRESCMIPSPELKSRFYS